MGRPLVWATALFAGGIGFEQWLAVALPLGWLFLALTILFIFGLILVLNGSSWAAEVVDSWSRPVGLLPAVILLLAFFALGLFRSGLDQASRQSVLLGDLRTYLYLTGVIIKDPQVYANRVVYVLEAREIRQGNWRKEVREKVQVTFSPSKSAVMGDKEAAGGGQNRVPIGIEHKYNYGDILQVYGQLKLPPTGRNPGEFDYRVYLAQRGIYTRMTVDEPGAVVRLAAGGGNWFMRQVLWVKGRTAGVIKTSLPSAEAAVLLAILFGDREGLDATQIDIYRSLGLMHFFAVSGLHAGFVLLFLQLLLGRLLYRRWLSFFLTVLGLMFYSAAAGFSPSILRASLMGILVLGAPLVYRKADVYSGLAAAALLLLLYNPANLMDTGFQLSFVATWGLVYLSQPVAHFLARAMPLLPPGLRGYLVIPLAAQLGVLPLTAYYFNMLSPVGLLVNALVAPLIGVVTITGLTVVLLAALWPGLAALPAAADGALLAGINASLSWVSGLPGSVFSIGSPHPFNVVLYFAGLALLRELWGASCRQREPTFPFQSETSRDNMISDDSEAIVRPHWRFITGLLVIVLGAAALFNLVRPLLWPPGLEVVFLDVGQGESIYLRTPGGRHVLIDGGGMPLFPETSGYRVGREVVLAFLRRQGVRRIDLMVSTHPDNDHLQGLFDVASALPVQLAVTPPANYFSGGYDDFFNLLADRRVKRAEVRRGDRILLEPGLNMTVLHPGHPLQGTRSDSNSNSLVLKVEYGPQELLITGDLEKEGMEDILRGWPDRRTLAADILTVPHHGSRYGLFPEFLRAVNPAVVVIQAGEDNSFGHPSPEILNFWRQEGVNVYRTDTMGAVIALPDNSGFKLQGLLGPGFIP